MVVGSGDARTEYTEPSVDEIREEFDYFGYCVLADTTLEPDGEDGLFDFHVIEAAHESAAEGCRIALEEGRDPVPWSAGRSRSYCRTALVEDRSLELGCYRW